MVHARETLVLPRTPQAAAHGRRHVAGLCAGLESDTCAHALLLTSELISNAVRHGDGRLELTVERADHSLRVAVGDDSPRLPVLLPPPPPDATGGRGLHLVRLLSSEWGVQPRADSIGKTVWFRLA